jgi:hypothetical protein
MIFRSILSDQYSVTPYPVFYDYQLTYVSGSPTPADITVSLCKEYNGSMGLERSPNIEFDLYNSILQTFYSPIPRAQYGITSESYAPTGSAWVIGVTQDLFGNEIVRGTFSIVANGVASTDDTRGNLKVSNATIGHIFYDKGIIIIQPTASTATVLNTNGLAIGAGGTIQVRFTSSLLLYEHQILVTIPPDALTVSAANPSARTVLSNFKTATTLMYNKEMLPYVTTIGLYNGENELLAVAKVSTPIQRTNDITQTFVIKFDT